MIRTKVKICGIKDKKQAIEIAALGVDAMGFVLYPPSPRHVTVSTLKSILPDLPPFLKTVGVVVNEPVAKLVEIVHATGLDVVQLCGDESPEYCQELTLLSISWLKAVRVKDGLDLSLLAPYSANCFLLDAWSETEFGGTGTRFDWGMLAGVRQDLQLVLAGGLTPSNIGAAIRHVSPYAVDVSSGVESEPGVKSIPKVKAFLKHLADAQRDIEG